MAWTWFRPADPGVLEGRPLLDVGAGDAATLRALAPDGLTVALDRSLVSLRTAARAGGLRAVCADAAVLPFGRAAFACVLCADLFHHLADDALDTTLGEVGSVLETGGTLVAWWYPQPPRHSPSAPDAPRHPRPFDNVASIARNAGFRRVEALDLVVELDPPPPAVGMRAWV